MLQSSPWTAALLAAVLAAAAAGAMAWTLRRAGVAGGPRSAAILGGILAGVLLGPMVLGRAAPEAARLLYTGAPIEHRTLAEQQAEHDRQIAALRASGVTPDAIDELSSRHEAVIRPLRQTLERAVAAHDARLNLVVAAVAGLLLLGAAPLALPASTTHWRRLLMSLTHSGVRALFAGFAAFIAAAGPPAIVASLFGAGLTSAVAVGTIFAAPAVAATLPGASLLICTGGLLAAFTAIGVVAWSLELGIVMTGVALGLMLALGADGIPRRLLRSVCTLQVVGVMLPALAALIVVRINPAELLTTRNAWVAIIVAVLWSADGRWFAGWLACRGVGPDRCTEPGPWARSARMVDAGASVIQLVAVQLAFAAAVVGPEMLLAAAVGAVAIELTRPLRDLLAARMN